MSFTHKAMLQLEGKPEDYYKERVNDAVRARFLRNAIESNESKVLACIKVNGLPETLEECITKAKYARYQIYLVLVELLQVGLIL